MQGKNKSKNDRIQQNTTEARKLLTNIILIMDERVVKEKKKYEQKKEYDDTCIRCNNMGKI